MADTNQFDQYTHYVNKVSNLPRIEAVLNALHSLMYGNFVTRTATFYTVRENARTVLGALGAAPADYGQYMGFIQQLKSKQEKFSGLTLTNVAQAIKDLRVARGQTSATLIQLANQLGITVV